MKTKINSFFDIVKYVNMFSDKFLKNFGQRAKQLREEKTFLKLT